MGGVSTYTLLPVLLLACSDSKKNAAPATPDLGAVPLALIDIEFSGDGPAIHQWAGVPLLATPTLTAAYANTTPARKIAAVTAPRTEGSLHLPHARLAQSDGFFEMRVLGIGQTEEELAILLVDLEDRLVFPFFVGLCQAASINVTLNHLK